MGDTNGSAASDLEKSAASMKLQKKVESYNFYQLVELLHRLQEEDPESEDWEVTCRLLFSANPSLGFAASDVTNLQVLNDSRLKLQTSFFGLIGSQSPLPGFFLERLATEGENGLRKPFLDFFNNRLIALVYRVWRKYRYYVRFKEDASDDFSAQLFALVGLADQNLRGETPINWCKMLSYAGMLAGRSRSPQVVSGIVAHCFDLADVTIRQWEVRKVTIPENQQMQLGMANARLGEDTLIGKEVQDCTGKFVIYIKGMTQERFKDFLPSGKEYLPFCKLIEFILREQMAFDLEMELKQDEAPPMQLGGQKGFSLGWSSFMGDSDEKRRIRIQIRQ
ncbi:type VI secretion system baseplate subunit TssG [Photobacterium indicum]|uniref:type VI secretion system baseplate subunit TssG n=1 Tax=Photobacterium indicum TaxID=81447 RepID=UPI003D146F26